MGLTIAIVLNASYAYCLVSDTWSLIALFTCFVVCFVSYFINRGVYKNALFYTSPIVILSFIVAISIVFHADYNSWGSYAHQFIVLFLGAILAFSIPVKKFAKYFVQFMTFITVIAIIMWIIVNVGKMALPLPIMTSKGGGYYPDYYNGIIFFMNTAHTLRVQGLFWEAGIYAATCVLALFFIEYIREETKRRKIKITLFIIGIILSMSTTGYILLVFYVVFQIVKFRQGYISIIVSCIIAIPLILGVLFQDQLITNLSLLFPEVFGKLTYENYSLSTRVMGPLLDLEIMKQNIVIGVGMTNYIELWPTYASQMAVESRTSTITYFLANFGFMGIMYFVAIIKAAINQKYMSAAGKIILFIVFASIVTSEPNYFNLLLTVCLVYCCKDSLLNTENRLQ